MVLMHVYECSKCRKMLKKESIKMCAGCKIMGYCSKECQRADWKEHKPQCKGAQTGSTAASRNPVIKVAERFADDPDVMCLIDEILIYALDLIHHPENASKYAVAIAGRVESTDVSMARDHIMALMSGQDRPEMPDRIPKLFQIVKAAKLENKFVPEGLERSAAAQKKTYQEYGYLTGKSAKPEYFVRAMFVTENDTPSAIYFARLINQAMLDEAASWKKWRNGVRTDEPTTTEEVIRLFNSRALEDPVMNWKLTIAVSSHEN